jgi:hypothetical protein
MPLGGLGSGLGARCPVLTGLAIGSTVFVWIDAAIFVARFQGYDGDNIALFSVDGVLLRVPCFQIRAVFT